jgi:hypothetical protein
VPRTPLRDPQALATMALQLAGEQARMLSLRQAVGLHGRRGGVRFSAALVQLGRTLVGTRLWH